MARSKTRRTESAARSKSTAGSKGAADTRTTKSGTKSDSATKSTASTSAGTRNSTAKKSTDTNTAAGTKPAPKKNTAKSTTNKQSAPDQLVVREDEAAWTRPELDEVLRKLHETRDRITQAMQGQQAELADLIRYSGEGAGHDQVDMGSTSFELDHEYNVVSNQRAMVAQIDRARARIDSGTYGQCESCGNPVGKMRLLAFPRATLCMSCKHREERR